MEKANFMRVLEEQKLAEMKEKQIALARSTANNVHSVGLKDQIQNKQLQKAMDR